MNVLGFELVFMLFPILIGWFILLMVGINEDCDLINIKSLSDYGVMCMGVGTGAVLGMGLIQFFNT